MEDEYKLSQHSGDSVTIELPGMVIITAILVFFLVLVFVLLLQLYAKWLWSRIEDPTPLPLETRRRRRRRRFEFSAVHDPNSARGLDPTVLRSLPVIIFHPDDFKDGLECAVCLSDLVEGEKAKLLHDCFHGFHSDCIDMWFQSHSTCPLCRNPVTTAVADTAELHDEDSTSGLSSESPTFPTNVLIWGNQGQVTSAGALLEVEEGPSQNHFPAASSSASTTYPDAELVIDVQNEVQFPPLTTNEDGKLPVVTRLRSLKRLLSRQRRVNPCNSNSANAESEQLP
ncbi:RING-H2 finger protein ATL3-like [Cucumis melo]|uniref:RING-type E3 ubiquitin transferase n=1 Tax=Cucumis melo TaxID=3656 RepID=A0A1S3CCE4_CUCME|nr:RING-H2 finger protein ATL3-like [Cucumis melo]